MGRHRVHHHVVVQTNRRLMAEDGPLDMAGCPGVQIVHRARSPVYHDVRTN